MNMEVAAARVIEAINHVPIRIQEGDGKFNMCEAIEEMIKVRITSRSEKLFFIFKDFHIFIFK